MSDMENCSRFDGIDPADCLRSNDLDLAKSTEDSVGEGTGEEAPHKIDDKNEYSIQCFTEADIVNWKYWRPDLAPPAPIPVLAGYCGICKDLVNHIPLFCPNQILRPGYCGVCKKEADHDTFHCPTFTQDQVKFFAFCQFCNENSYHTTSKCPHAEFVYINGHKIPNVCCDCHKTGHVFLDCPDADSEHSDDYL